MTDHLRPTATIAADALLPADPGLALALAQRLLVKPLMSNHHHGLWGYSGVTAEGLELTVQSTGIGGASATAVAAELGRHGVRRAIRLGRCRGLAADDSPGAQLVVGGAVGGDAISGAVGVAGPEPELLELLAAAAPQAAVATVAGCDLLASLDDERQRREWLARGAAAADLETASLLAFCAANGIAAAAALVVARDHAGARDEARVEGALGELAEACAAALAGAPEEPLRRPIRAR